MTDWTQKAEALNRLIRPLTFPIAVKLVKGCLLYTSPSPRD